jgi:diguanylate cyclase (GGDEF)-like protein/PAS domain S-box-containing protein
VFVDSPPDGERSSRAELVRRWAGALATSVFVALRYDEVERSLADLFSKLVDAATAGPFSAAPAVEAGNTVVQLGFTAPESLERSVALLGEALPAQPELAALSDADERIIRLLAAFCAGFSRALRDWVFGQQNEVNRALFKAHLEAKRDLRVTEAQFSEIFTESAVGIAITDLHGRFVRTNTSLADILDYSVVEIEDLTLFQLFHDNDAAYLRAHYQGLQHGPEPRFREPMKLRKKGGDEAFGHLSVSMLRDADERPQYFVTMVDDVTEVHLLQGRLNHQVLHDLLTNLPNRQYFVSRLETALARADTGPGFILCQLDIDGVGVVNDGVGHQAGDTLLRMAARRLENVVGGDTGMVARLGGCRFAMLVEKGPLAPDAEDLASMINKELSEPVYVDGRGLAVSASIGMIDVDGATSIPAELLAHADIALRRAKAGGKAQWALFNQEDDGGERDQLALAAAMPGALENGEFGIDFEPLVNLAEQKVVAMRARLNWRLAGGRLLGHNDCVELAEQTGLVLGLGRWMMLAACERAKAWLNRFGVTAPPVMIELTTQQAADGDLSGRIRDTLTESGLEPNRLLVGFPMTALEAAIGDIEDNLRTADDQGARVYLTGFGGGDFDLACVEDLPVHAVELAERLVGRVGVCPDNAAPVTAAARAVVPLVRGREVAVLAGPLTEPAQVDWWREIGVTSGYGPCFAGVGAPLPGVTPVTRPVM